MLSNCLRSLYKSPFHCCKGTPQHQRLQSNPLQYNYGLAAPLEDLQPPKSVSYCAKTKDFFKKKTTWQVVGTVLVLASGAVGGYLGNRLDRPSCEVHPNICEEWYATFYGILAGAACVAVPICLGDLAYRVYDCYSADSQIYIIPAPASSEHYQAEEV